MPAAELMRSLEAWSGCVSGALEKGEYEGMLGEAFSMGQSKVSYHVKKLKDAGLVREERSGKWTFYSLDGEAARSLLAEAERHLDA